MISKTVHVCRVTTLKYLKNLVQIQVNFIVISLRFKFFPFTKDFIKKKKELN